MIEPHSKGFLEAHVVFKNYKMSVASKELTADLLLLCFLGFDIILGMDLLKNYWVIIDCESKVVTLHSPKWKQL